MKRLYEVALSLYQKITTTNDWTIDDMTLFNNIYHILDSAGYGLVRKLNDIIKLDSKYNNMIKSEITKKYNESDKIFKQFYYDIGFKVMNILNKNLDENDICFTNYDNIVSLDKAKKMINDYYHKVDPKCANIIEDTLSSNRVYIKTASKYVTVPVEGSAVIIDNNPYVSLVSRTEDDSIDTHALIALVHELGHSIGLKQPTTNSIDCYSPLREAIPKTHEYTFCKKYIKGSEEYKMHILPEMLLLKITTDNLYKNNNDNISRPYTLGIYVGLYLSHLYMTDINKFNYLYNELKKYIFTNEESKILDLFKQDKEIKTGEFLKKEIEDIQKLIKKK